MLSRRQSVLPIKDMNVFEVTSAIARGCTSSINVSRSESSPSKSTGSFVQSIRKTEPLESETTSSLEVLGCEQTEHKGCANAITKAVGWFIKAAGRVGLTPSASRSSSGLV